MQEQFDLDAAIQLERSYSATPGTGGTTGITTAAYGRGKKRGVNDGDRRRWGVLKALRAVSVSAMFFLSSHSLLGALVIGVLASFVAIGLTPPPFGVWPTARLEPSEAVAAAESFRSTILLGNTTNGTAIANGAVNAAWLAPGSVLNSKPDGLFWFIQVSDSHISKFGKEEALKFRLLVEEVVPIIKPAFVIASGDLVDSQVRRRRTVLRFKQQENEWREYRTILETHNLFTWDKWKDIPGNHDSYSVLELNASNNWMKDYSTFGVTFGPATEIVEHIQTTSYGSAYRFIFFRNTELPAPQDTYFGWVNGRHIEALKDLLKTSSDYQHNILVSHYCSNYIQGPSGKPFLNEIDMKPLPFTMFLCGHLHTPRTYWRMSAGFVELEINTLKKKTYRIVAFDHDLWSFVDASIGEWPVVLITNPKSAQLMTENEPTFLVSSSSHIRALVFSPTPIANVIAKIDGVVVCPSMIRDPMQPWFYSCPWDASEFLTGIHKITVTATSSSTISTSTRQQPSQSTSSTSPFSLNFTLVRFAALYGFILLFYLYEWLLALMLTFVIITIIILLVAPLLGVVVPQSWKRSVEPYLEVIDNLESGSKTPSSIFDFGCSAHNNSDTETSGHSLASEAKLTVFSQLTLLLLYSPLRKLWQSSHIPLYIRAIHFVGVLLPFLVPIGYGSNGLTGCSVLFSWGIGKGPNNTTFHTTWSFAYMTAFYFTVALPLVNVSCNTCYWVFLYKKQAGRGVTIRKTMSAILLDVFLCLVAISGCAGMLVMQAISYSTLWAFLSPLVWLCTAPFLATFLSVLLLYRFNLLYKFSNINWEHWVHQLRGTSNKANKEAPANTSNANPPKSSALVVEL
ncbi:transmembrane protein 62-like [Pelomyxa schiedti]|nr:transmembrane protein 62-like [Pelomyxa schiedti]